MKKLLFVIAVILPVYTVIGQQPCLPNGITFTTQTSIDNFTVNYGNCTHIGGTVSIDGDDYTITNLNGLSAIISIDGSLLIKETDLVNLSGLNNLTTVTNGLHIGDHNNKLISLAGLDSLTNIGGDLRIEYNSNLENLEGLQNLNAVGQSLIIKSNDSLKNLHGLSGLNSVGVYLEVTFNDVLEVLDGLNQLTSVGSGITIQFNSSLKTFDAMANLTTIGDDLRFSSNKQLQRIDGLESLTELTGELTVFSNDSLASIAGFENLAYIEDLNISNNEALRNLDEIAGIINIDGDLTLKGNDLLSSCAVKSICEYLSNPNGAIDIQENKVGCNTVAQVENACLEVGTDEFDFNKEFSVYPNPSGSMIYISSLYGIPLEGISVYGVTGKKLLMSTFKPDEGLDVASLTYGYYIIEVSSGGFKKYIKAILGN